MRRYTEVVGFSEHPETINDVWDLERKGKPLELMLASTGKRYVITITNVHDDYTGEGAKPGSEVVNIEGTLEDGTEVMIFCEKMVNGDNPPRLTNWVLQVPNPHYFEF